jgi:hypothetical protein
VSIINGTWTAGQPINASVDGLALGSWSYLIIATDPLLRQITSSEVSVIVNDMPQISHQGLNSMMVSASGCNVTWTINDTINNNANYIIYVNGIAITNGTWTSDAKISHIFDTGTPGNYNITIMIQDGYGEVVYDTFWLAVLPTYIQSMTPVASLIGIFGVLAILGIPIIIAIRSKGKKLV